MTNSTSNYRPVLSIETRDDLAALAQALGFNSTPTLLEALAELYYTDPIGTRLAFEVQLKAHDLLPERSPKLME